MHNNATLYTDHERELEMRRTWLIIFAFIFVIFFILHKLKGEVYVANDDEDEIEEEMVNSQ